MQRFVKCASSWLSKLKSDTTFMGWSKSANSFASQVTVLRVLFYCLPEPRNDPVQLAAAAERLMERQNCRQDYGGNHVPAIAVTVHLTGYEMSISVQP